MLPLTHLPVPALQASPVVHGFPSLHVRLLPVWVQPEFWSHASVVQTFASSHGAAVPPWHAPLLHASPTVQGLPSLQVPVKLAWTQPLALSQLSAVHVLVSSQLIVVPVHTPPAQKSLLVQALPSSQAEPMFVFLHAPLVKSQTSAVHGFKSSQLTTAPARQLPLPSHLSPFVHGLPSSQLAPMTGVNRQPLTLSHWSVVHGLPSEHFLAVPAHVPLLQVSLTVQAMPSSHAPLKVVYLQTPVTPSQTSAVQGLPSSQTTGVPA